MRNRYSYALFYLLIVLPSTSIAQFGKEILKNNQYQIGLGAYIATSPQLPFWLHANQYGEIPFESQFFQFFGNIKHDYDSLYNIEGKLKKFNWGYGARAVANVGKVNQLILSEGYAKVRYGAFEFYAGRRKEIFGIVDTLLTSGSYIWSGNALPLPKLQLSIPNYIPLLKNGLISMKGGYAHGWFDNRRLYTSNIKLHQKWLYFKFGKPPWRLNFYAGGNHEVQWGGYSPFYTVDGKLPDGLKNYFYVVMGTRGAIKDTPETGNVEANRIGNHLGSIDLGLTFRINKINGLLYRQSFYDDGSLFFLNNVSDGLMGLSLEFKKTYANFSVKKILFEYFDSSSQGGQAFLLYTKNNPAPNELRGSDQYFSNAQIRDGWVNNNRTIGTPFISVQNELMNSNSNRIKFFNFSTHLSIKNYQINFKQTFVEDLGTYSDPIDMQNILSLVSVRRPFAAGTISLLLSNEWYTKRNGFAVKYLQNL
jgi:hypothetical protein